MAKYCCVCGEKASHVYEPKYSFRTNMVVFDVPEKEGCICHECGAALYRIRGFNINDQNLRAHIFVNGIETFDNRIYSPGTREKGLNYLEPLVPNIKNPIVKEKVVELLEACKQNLERCSSFESKSDEVICKIKTMLEPYASNEKASVGLSTAWVKDDSLYYTEYGLGFIEQIQKPKMVNDLNRLQVLDEYENILKRDSLLNVISIDDILFFQEKGDIQYSTVVSGGGGHGGGVNAGGALIGGLLFGGAGAIIGSNIGTDTVIDPITSRTKEHDNRYVVLRYKDKDGIIKEDKFAYEYYDKVFMNLIPQKEYSHVNLQSNPEPVKNDNKDNYLEQIKQLKELFDMGAITQEEFDNKKKQLLGI